MTSRIIKATIFSATLPLCAITQSLSAATFGKFTYTSDGTSITITGYDRSDTGAVVIPSAIDNKPVTSIGDYGFYSCPSLTSISIPNSVTYIGKNAFSDCSALTTISIPNTVTSIGNFPRSTFAAA